MIKINREDRLASYAFNLLEIMMAFVVVVIGVVGVMTLFPISQKANQASVGNTSSADAGDQFLRVLASKVKVNWDLTTALPMSRPENYEGEMVFSSRDTSGLLHDIDGITIMYNDTDGDETFDYDGANGDVDSTGIFKIVQHTDQQLKDFTAIVRVWRTPASYRRYDARTGEWTLKSVPPTTGVELNVELSYPAELPYDARTKRQFALSVFRPQENPAQGYVFSGVLGSSNINLPPTLGVSGTLNINPNNSAGGNNPEFHMTTPGGPITRDDLMNAKGPANSVYYSGKATAIFVRPKGNGNQNGVTLTGSIELNGFSEEQLVIQNAYGYHFTSERAFDVVLWQGQNANDGEVPTGDGSSTTTDEKVNNGKAGGKDKGDSTNGPTRMGAWWIEIVGQNAVVTRVF